MFQRSKRERESAKETRKTYFLFYIRKKKYNKIERFKGELCFFFQPSFFLEIALEFGNGIFERLSQVLGKVF